MKVANYDIVYFLQFNYKDLRDQSIAQETNLAHKSRKWKKLFNILFTTSSHAIAHPVEVKNHLSCSLYSLLTAAGRVHVLVVV